MKTLCLLFGLFCAQPERDCPQEVELYDAKIKAINAHKAGDRPAIDAAEAEGRIAISKMKIACPWRF